MLFISAEFLLFACITIPLFFAVPQQWRILYLLVISFIFYAFSYPPNLIILVGVIIADYFIARQIGRSETPARRNQLLILSIFINLGLLFIFKYFTFFYDSITAISNSSSDSVQSGIALTMPLGISFYTFTKLAYVIDVYRKKITPEPSFLAFATFVSFFPNVTSGPIERAGHLIPQLKQSVQFDEKRVVEGLRLILWGVFKKVVIADTLAIYVNGVYSTPQQQSSAALLIGTLFFAFQIYADFSGYTDIARGIAHIFGIELFENFNQPYLSKSILEFWRRWHISLTTWIREYLFFPLSRALLKRTHRRFPRLVEISVYLITMSLIGLWHGTSWTFVVWGLLHGIYMAVESVLNAYRIRFLPKNSITDVVKVVTTFLLVAFAWIFFRVNSIADAVYVVMHLFQFDAAQLSFSAVAAAGGWATSGLLVAFGLIALLLAADGLAARFGLNSLLARMPGFVRWAYYYGTTAAIFITLSAFSTAQQFIYFRF